MPRKYVRVADRVEQVATGMSPHLADVLEQRTRKNEETMERIIAAFSSAGSADEWYIKVHRISGNNRHGFGEPYLFTMSPDELDGIHDKLRDEYGSGRYRCRAYQNRGLVNSFEVEVEAQVEPERLQRIPELVRPAETASIAQMIELSGQKLLLSFEQRLAAATPIATAAIDPMAMFTQFAGLMTAMKGLMPDPPAQNLDVLIRGIELAKEFGGSAGGETGLMDVVRELVKSPVIENVLGNMAAARGMVLPAPQQPPPAAAPARLMLPANPTPVMPVSGPNHQAMPQGDVNNFVAQQLNTLVALAAAGTDPALLAETVYDNLPDATLEYIVTSQNILAELAQIDPRVGNHKIWFQHLLAAIKQIDTEAQADEAPGTADGNVPDSGGASGNGPDAAGNAQHHPAIQDQPGHTGTGRKVGAKAAA